MGIIKQGILGGFSNKVGNVVGSSWKGIAVVKTLPLSVANPNTAAQIEQRGKFANVQKLASTLLNTIVKPFWDRFAQRQSGYNAFISANIDNFDQTQIVNFPAMKMSKGKLGATTITSATLVDTTNEITINWPAIPVGSFQQTTDQAYAVIIDTTNDQVVLQLNLARTRGQGGLPATGGQTWIVAGRNYALYLLFRRPDGTEVSDSGYLNVLAA